MGPWDSGAVFLPVIPLSFVATAKKSGSLLPDVPLQHAPSGDAILSLGRKQIGAGQGLRPFHIATRKVKGTKAAKSGPMVPPLPPLVGKWIDSLRSFDLEALVDCYSHSAVVTAFEEQARGHEEIGDQLTAFKRYLRGVQVDSIRPLPAAEGRFCFETWVRGRLGHALIRHDWIMADGHITDHAMCVMERSLRAT